MANPDFTDLPNDVLQEIMRKVSIQSAYDFSNAAAKCHSLSNIAKQQDHLKHMNLRVLPDRASITDNLRSFLQACMRQGNLEALFRIGMDYLFCRLIPSRAIDCFVTAALSGHPESIYMSSMHCLCSETPQVTALGIDLLQPIIANVDDPAYLHLPSVRKRVYTFMCTGEVDMAVLADFRPKNLEDCFCDRCLPFAEDVEILRVSSRGMNLWTTLCPVCKCHADTYYFSMELLDHIWRWCIL